MFHLWQIAHGCLILEPVEAMIAKGEVLYHRMRLINNSNGLYLGNMKFEVD